MVPLTATTGDLPLCCFGPGGDYDVARVPRLVKEEPGVGPPPSATSLWRWVRRIGLVFGLDHRRWSRLESLNVAFCRPRTSFAAPVRDIARAAVDGASTQGRPLLILGPAGLDGRPWPPPKETRRTT